MEIEPFENPWIKKIRVLTHLLLVSIVFNIGLTTALITAKSRSSDRRSKAVVASKPHKLNPSNAEVVRELFQLSFQELAENLNCVELLQDGYAKRDLVLSCLTQFHHFDLKRAVVGKDLQRRTLSFVHSDGGEEFALEVFPALDETDFQLIQNFIRREKWPLTTQGLFDELKKTPNLQKLTSSLAQSFVSTSEFYTLYTLFRRKSDNVKASEVLQMLLEGPWEFFEEFIVAQKTLPDLTEESMRSLLTKYVRYGVPAASLLWIKLDSDYVLRGVDDYLLQEVIKPLSQPASQLTIFLKQLLCSVRSDELRKLAAIKLYTFEGVTPPSPFNHEQALRHFLPAMFAEEKAVEAEVEPYYPKCIMHTVKEGESLWKIAKKYHVSINDIRKVNKLKSDKLRPKQKIQIPSKKN